MAAKGSSEVVEKFSRLPTPQKVAVFVGIGAVLAGLYWYLFYSDMSEQLTQQQAAARKLAQEETRLKERKKQYRELLDKKEQIEKTLATNAISLPASSELPSFFVSLQAQAIAANVQLIKWTRLDEVPVETYVKVPVSMEVRGDFYQVMNYFKLLHETRRIITVEDLFVGEGKREGSRYLLTARFTASTFRQADLPPQAGEQPAPGQPGAPKPKPGGAAPAPGAPGKAGATPAKGGGK
jgi:Tfp pilus assembly protein PilO